jgi:hypothetical protein
MCGSTLAASWLRPWWRRLGEDRMGRQICAGGSWPCFYPRRGWRIGLSTSWGCYDGCEQYGGRRGLNCVGPTQLHAAASRKKNGERFFGLVGNRYGLLLFFFFSFSNLFFCFNSNSKIKNASFNNDRACKLEFCTIYSFILFTYPNTFKYIVHIHKQYIQTQYHIACGPIKSAPIFITYLF